MANLLSDALPKAVAIFFDDHDDSNVYPADFYEWAQRGANLEEFDCPGMVEAVTNELKKGTAEFIVLDFPFGRDHAQFQSIINLSVYIDTPLDVAMARRIARDLNARSATSAEKRLNSLASEMADYDSRVRPVYLVSDRHKNSSDLILNGLDPLESLRDQILAKLGSDLVATKPPYKD